MTSSKFGKFFRKSKTAPCALGAITLLTAFSTSYAQLAVEKPLVVMLAPEETNPAYQYTQPLRDGILAAYEQDKDNYLLKKVTFKGASDIEQVLNKAAEDGAMLVLGPVLRASVDAIVQKNFLPVPVIAISHISAAAAPQLMINLDISSEAELPALAEAAVMATQTSSNAGRPFLILGTQSPYDQRLMAAMEEEIRKAGASAIKENFSAQNSVKTAINAGQNGYRGIFFACNSAYASLLRPYLGDTPTFGTNYSNPHNNADRMTAQTQANDLRGMVTMEIPVLSPEKSGLGPFRKKLAPLNGDQKLMFAAGVDVWNLGKDWLQWKSPSQLQDGLTGSLTLDRSRSHTVGRGMEAKPITAKVQTHAQEEPDFVE